MSSVGVAPGGRSPKAGGTRNSSKVAPERAQNSPGGALPTLFEGMDERMRVAKTLCKPSAAGDSPLGSSVNLFAARQRRSASVAPPPVQEPAYPMYVLSMKNFNTLSMFVVHQELLRSDMLEVYKPEMDGRVMFVSHQWAGHEHCDPGGNKFRCLQRVLRRMMFGEVCGTGDTERASETVRVTGTSRVCAHILGRGARAPRAFWPEPVRYTHVGCVFVVDVPGVRVTSPPPPRARLFLAAQPVAGQAAARP